MNTFQEDYDNLENIVQKLSKEQTDLDKSIELFKEGIALYNKCQKKIEDAQKEVVNILNENNEEVEYEVD